MAGFEKAVADIVAIAIRIIANQVEREDQATAMALAADRLKVKAAAQRELDARRAKK